MTWGLPESRAAALPVEQDHRRRPVEERPGPRLLTIKNDFSQ